VSREIDPAAAALIEPFACVYRGQEAVRIEPGDVVLVIGAGPVGVMHALLAQMRGAGRVIVSELLPERVEQARRTGLERVVDSRNEDLAAVIAEESSGAGADVVIVAAPAHKAQEMALELAAIGGRINFFGGLPKNQPAINFNSNLVHYKELVVTGTTACSTNDCRHAAAIVESKRIDLSKLVGQRFPLTSAREAFTAVEAGKSLKVVIQP
jgi:L-iditol 2-dehydrogenase